MSALNSVLRILFDFVISLLSGFPAIVGVAILSLVTAIGMLLVFRYASNQEKMAEVKSRIHACVFEIRLFNDDLRAILRAQAEILRHNGTYISLTIKPMLVMIVPIVLLIAQMQFHYGYTGLEPGEDAVLTVFFNENLDSGNNKPNVQVEAPEGLAVETGSVWIPAKHEMSWRVGAEKFGEYELKIDLGGEVVTKSVLVSDAIARRSPNRLAPEFFNQLLYPAEDPLPKGSPIRSIEFDYPDEEVGLFGFRLHWLIWYFILSIAFAFSLRRVFGVTI
jgi:uncharacterized membrane protein (DUF106 family)